MSLEHTFFFFKLKIHNILILLHTLKVLFLKQLKMYSSGD